MSQDNDNSPRNSCPHQQPPRPPATAPQAGAVWVRRGGHRGRTVSQPETGKPHQDRDGLFQLDLAENKKRWSEQEEDTLSGKHSLESEAEHNKQLPHEDTYLWPLCAKMQCGFYLQFERGGKYRTMWIVFPDYYFLQRQRGVLGRALPLGVK